MKKMHRKKESRKEICGNAGVDGMERMQNMGEPQNTEKHIGDENTEDFSVRLNNALTYDRLHALSVEYSVSVEYLVDVAVRRMLDDVEFVRKLRMGKLTEEFLTYKTEEM